MKCPKCESEKISITETIQNADLTFRRRLCKMCFHVFKTKEEVFEGALPQKRRNLVQPEPKEYQKLYQTDAIKRFWGQI
jgi:transcriptional regulator NrdR family protein